MSASLPMACVHLVEHFRKGSGPRGPYYSVLYSVDDYSKVDAFINALRGSGSLTGPVVGGTVTRTGPHQYPLSPNCVCVSAEMVQGLGEPILNAEGMPNFSGGALISAEYAPLEYEAAGSNQNHGFDPATPILWCTQELDYSYDTIVIPKGTMYRYTEGPDVGKFTGTPMTIHIPITVLNLTFHALPYMPMYAVRNLRGRVNSSPFLGAATGCVRFLGGRTSRDWNADGSVVQRLSLCMEERAPEQPWNSEPGLGSTTFYHVEGLGSTTKYPVADLSPLIQF